MSNLITFFITFIIIYLVYFIFIISNKKRLEKFSNNNYFNYFIKKYKLDRKKIDIKNTANIIVLANSFIISFTFSISFFISNFMLKMLLCFAVLILTILVVYGFIGKLLNNKYKKDL